MAGGGGKTETTTTKPPAFQEPYLRVGLGESLGLLGSPPEIYGGPGIAPMSQDTASSYDVGRGIAGTLGGLRTLFNDEFRSATNTDIASLPEYQNALGSIRDSFNLNNDRALAQVAESFAPGAFGGSDMQIAQALTTEASQREFGNAASQLASNFYGIQSTARNNAMANIPGLLLGNQAQYNLLSDVGSRQDLRRQLELEDAIGTFNAYQNQPEEALDRYLARISGNYGSVVTAPSSSPSRISSALSGGLGGAAVGSAIPGIGSLVGGGIGLLAGLL